MFANGTYGLNIDGIAKEGPMAGKGYARMTCKEALSDLLGAWHIDSIDLSMYTLDGIDNQHWIKEWIVIARK